MLVLWILAAAFALIANIILQVLDIVTTVTVLDAGASEQNPWSRAIMDAWGIWAWVALKVLLVAALVAALWWVGRAPDREVRRVILPASLVGLWMFGVVMNNFRVLERM